MIVFNDYSEKNKISEVRLVVGHQNLINIL